MIAHGTQLAVARLHPRLHAHFTYPPCEIKLGSACCHIFSQRGGAAVRKSQRYLAMGVALAAVPVGVITAAPAFADCTNAGAATVCAQGTVRGGGPDAPTAGPVYPSYCADPWYCDDGWGLDVILPLPPRPIRPGGGGGIGPR